jgi:PE family
VSFVTTQPDALAASANALLGIGSAVNAGNEAAEVPTTGVIPPAADQVSALITAQFVAHAQTYQTVSAQATAIHQQLVATLAVSAASYATTEAASAAAVG